MVVDRKSLIKTLSALMSDVKVRKVRHPVGAAVSCGISCTVGGIFLGPPGLALGGVLGGLLALTDKLFSIDDVLGDLSDEQYEQLVKRLQNIAEKFSLKDLTVLESTLDTDKVMRKAVIEAVTSFITDELKLKINNGISFLNVAF